MDRWEQASTDRQILWPKLQGMNHNTRTEIRQIQPRNTASFGNPCLFDMYLKANFLKDVVLELTLSPIVTPGSTFNAYRNDIGSGIIQAMRVYQSSSTIQERNSNDLDEFVFRDLFFQSFEGTQYKAEANGILPFATRSARSGANQTFFVSLYSVFDYLAVPLSILSDAVQLELVFKPLNRCVQTDGAIAGTVASIVSAVLRCEYVQVSPNLMNDLLTLSTTQGVEFPYIDIASQSFTENVGTQQIRELFGQSRGMGPYIFGFLRFQNDVYNATGDPLAEWTNTVPISTYNLQIDGINVISNPNDLPIQYAKHQLTQEAHCYTDPATYNTTFPIFHTFALEPFADLHLQQPILTGYYNFDMASRNSYIIVNLPAPLAQTAVLTMFESFANSLIISNGSIRKNLI